MKSTAAVSFLRFFAGIFVLVIMTACGPEQTSQLDEARNGKYGVLVQKIEQGGTLPVIIGLAGVWQNDATLPADEQQKQRNNIAIKQTQILNEMQNLNVTNIRKFETLPFMAMTVNIDGLLYLATSPFVASIEEDVVLEAH